MLDINCKDKITISGAGLFGFLFCFTDYISGVNIANPVTKEEFDTRSKQVEEFFNLLHFDNIKDLEAFDDFMMDVYGLNK